MGFRKKIKSLLRKSLFRTKPPDLTEEPPSTPTYPPTTDRTNFYHHANTPIQPFQPPIGPFRPPPRTTSAPILIPTSFTHKSYTTASGLVIPPDFDYSRPSTVYTVQGLNRTEWRGNVDIDDNTTDDGFSIADSEVPTASDYSQGELTRMTELALGAHEPGASLGEVEPRPLPEVPGDGEVVVQKRRGVRILTGEAMRKVKGLRMFSAGGKKRV